MTANQNGKNNPSYKHGMTKTPTWHTWRAMRQRCNDPNMIAYSRYGGAGIKVCKRWDDFRVFLKDMGERPQNTTLDRINNKGNYEPNNCRWADHKTQQNNKNIAKGSRNGRARLTEFDVYMIKDRLKRKEPYKSISKLFGVSISMIGMISSGRNWSHVD